MSLTMLLSPAGHHLKRVALGRVQLDQQSPAVVLSGVGVEGVLYALTGTVNLYVDGQYSGRVGQRDRMHEEVAQAVRFRGCGDITLTLTQQSYAADMLWITCGGIQVFSPSLYHHLSDVQWHTVGEGTHLRRVAEIPTPPGCELFCGETHNVVGGWSSWPPHATPEDIARFANGETTHEEVFFCVCRHPGVAILHGVYTGGVAVNKMHAIENGGAYVVPLGSHPVIAHPESSLMYIWAFCGTALSKKYNARATDLNTYIK